MKNLKSFILIPSFLILMLGFDLEAGGGYVGNGPTPAALALLTPSFRPNPQFYLSEEDVDSYQNYFLLKKNEIEIQAGVLIYQARSPILRITREGLVPADDGYTTSVPREWSWYPSFNFGVGITPNITWHGLTNLSFGVVNNSGQGYEMAVSVGLTTNGVNGQHAYPYFSYFTPGVSILQTWSHEDFRIVNALYGSMVMLSDFEWRFNELGSSLYFFYDFYPKWRAGMGIGGAFYNTREAGFFEEPELIGPAASLTYQALDNLSLSLTTRFQLQDTVYPQPGLVLGFRW